MFDLRMTHPRKIISQNYHHIENNPIASKLFPRKNIIASCKRLTNLGKILSPTTQKAKPLLVPDPGVGPGGGADLIILDETAKISCR
jgi:hypothetical protein